MGITVFRFQFELYLCLWQRWRRRGRRGRRGRGRRGGAPARSPRERRAPARLPAALLAHLPGAAAPAAAPVVHRVALHRMLGHPLQLGGDRGCRDRVRMLDYKSVTKTWGSECWLLSGTHFQRAAVTVFWMLDDKSARPITSTFHQRKRPTVFRVRQTLRYVFQPHLKPHSEVEEISRTDIKMVVMELKMCLVE